MESLCKQDLQILWLIGTLERLSNLGYVQNAPFRISGATDLYLSLDAKTLFPSEDELKEVLYSLVLAANKDNEDYEESVKSIEKDLPDLSDLVMDFRNNPTRFITSEMEMALSAS